ELVVARRLELGDVLDARNRAAAVRKCRGAALRDGRIAHLTFAGIAAAVPAAFQHVGRGERRGGEHGGQKDRDAPHHVALTRMVPSASTTPVKITPLSILRARTTSPTEPGWSGTAVSEMTSAPWLNTACTGLPASTAYGSRSEATEIM